MNVIVHGRHMELSEKFRDEVDTKLEKIERFGLAFTTIDVEVTHESNPRQADRAVEVELTCRGGGPVIRAEAAAADKYVALDLACEHLEDRIRRMVERKHHHRKTHVVRSTGKSNGQVAPVLEVEVEEIDSDVVLEAGPLIVREKVHPAQPMTVEQALEEMELVGHDFFLFMDSADGRPSVVYRRRGYDYGLIRLQG